MKAAIILENGFEDIEAIACKDILTRAGIEVTLYGHYEIVESNHHTKIITDELINDNINNNDIIILPGGLKGAYNLASNSNVLKYLNEFNKKNKWIAAICAAPIVLKKANVLNDKFATVYHDDELIKILENNYINKNVYCDKNIITASGPGQTFNFSLLILEKLNISIIDIKKEMII